MRLDARAHPGAPRRPAVLTSRLRRIVGILSVDSRRYDPTTLEKRAPDPFRTLVACVISLRTKDAVTDAAARRLFSLARSPRALAGLTTRRIARAIYPAGFYRTKARHLRGIARTLLAEHGGRVPADRDALMALPGVGLKCANLVLGRAFRQPAICVDVHVHRISNRLGLVRTEAPEETEAALRRVLPRRLWIRWNGWLVGYGQRICQPVSPWCSRCRLRPLCPRRGVGRSR